MRRWSFKNLRGGISNLPTILLINFFSLLRISLIDNLYKSRYLYFFDGQVLPCPARHEISGEINDFIDLITQLLDPIYYKIQMAVAKVPIVFSNS